MPLANFTSADLADICVDTTVGLDGPEHDADLFLPEFIDFDDYSKINESTARRIGQPGVDHLEWRGAVGPEQNDWPTKVFGIEIADPQVWSLNRNGWELFYEPTLIGRGKGGYLGDDDMPSRNPYEQGRGKNLWVQLGDRHYGTAWMVDSVMLHFWAGRKAKAPVGHSAEIACGLIRLTAPTSNHILGGIGMDYYPSSTTNNNKAPGPGIQRYRTLGTEWQPFAWLTPSPGYSYDEQGLRHFIKDFGLPRVAMLDRLPAPQDVPPEPPIVVTPPVDPEPTPDPEPPVPPALDEAAFARALADEVVAELAGTFATKTELEAGMAECMGGVARVLSRAFDEIATTLGK